MKTSLTTSRRRGSGAIGAGSMADIAFLLLIFFLVATTIISEQGIMVRLPPITPGEPAPIAERNVFSVKINASDELLAEGKRVRAGELRNMVRLFALNPERLPDLADAPTKAVISLQHDRATHYERYIEVYNELVAAYREMWQEKALQVYGTPYERLSDAARKAIRKQIPMVISEAEYEY